jgi:hypothetical protein
MKVRLAELQLNPYRDYKIDPIDKNHVKQLAASIKEHGFWSGVVTRKINGVIQIAAGHHRIEAAKLAGIEEAEVFVGKFDDAQMVRIYANENATQRGTHVAAAQTGSVAGAIRFLAKEMITPKTRQLAGLGLEKKIIGEDVIAKFLDGVPGINSRSINNELANLKSSGEYARILQEVQKEIEQSGASAKVIEHARKATEAAEKRTGGGSGEPTFDLRGTLKHFTTDDHVRVFREMVTGEGVKPFLPVERQKDVAKALVDLRGEISEQTGKEIKMTAEFIHNNLMDMVSNVKRESRELTKRDEKAIREKDIEQKWDHYMEMFCRNCRSTINMGNKMADLIKENPKAVFRQSAEFIELRAMFLKMTAKLHVEI